MEAPGLLEGVAPESKQQWCLGLAAGGEAGSRGMGRRAGGFGLMASSFSRKCAPRTSAEGAGGRNPTSKEQWLCGRRRA